MDRQVASQLLGTLPVRLKRRHLRVSYCSLCTQRLLTIWFNSSELRYASQDKLSKLVNVRIDLKEVLKVSPGYRRQQHKQLDEVVPQPQSRGCGFPLALFLVSINQPLPVRRFICLAHTI